MDLYAKMIRKGIRIDEVNYNLLLDTWIQGNAIGIVSELLEEMNRLDMEVSAYVMDSYLSLR